MALRVASCGFIRGRDPLDCEPHVSFLKSSHTSSLRNISSMKFSAALLALAALFTASIAAPVEVNVCLSQS
jgi:hypothetical protein